MLIIIIHHKRHQRPSNLTPAYDKLLIKMLTIFIELLYYTVGKSGRWRLMSCKRILVPYWGSNQRPLHHLCKCDDYTIDTSTVFALGFIKSMDLVGPRLKFVFGYNGLRGSALILPSAIHRKKINCSTRDKNGRHQGPSGNTLSIRNNQGGHLPGTTHNSA